MGLFKVNELRVYTQKKLLRFNLLCTAVSNSLVYCPRDLHRVLLLHLLQTFCFQSRLFSLALENVAVTSEDPFKATLFYGSMSY